MLAPVSLPQDYLNVRGHVSANNCLPLLLMPLKSEEAAQLLLTEKVTITVVWWRAPSISDDFGQCFYATSSTYGSNIDLYLSGFFRTK